LKSLMCSIQYKLYYVIQNTMLVEERGSEIITKRIDAVVDHICILATNPVTIFLHLSLSFKHAPVQNTSMLFARYSQNTPFWHNREHQI
jgi:hypothetical protein